ncbi:MAG: TonB-dependent receptor plug domain-containing protein [Gemmatimonadota bacterium]
MRFHTAAMILIGAGALAGAPAALAAQIVEGRVVAHESEEPLNAVELTLLGAEGPPADTALSDSTGTFRLVAPEPGVWRVAAALIGYGRVVSHPLEIDDQRALRLEVRMAVEPVELDEPIVVVAEWSTMSPDIAEFHRRRQMGERMGMGVFFYGEELERWAGMSPTDVLRMVPGVQVTQRGRTREQVVLMRGRCVPAIYLDGMQINRFDAHDSLDRYVSIESIEGIEVYRGSQQPGRFHDPSGCGLVLVWTKRGYYTDEPFPWRKFLIGLALMGGLLLLR